MRLCSAGRIWLRSFGMQIYNVGSSTEAPVRPKRSTIRCEVVGRFTSSALVLVVAVVKNKCPRVIMHCRL